MYNLHTMKWHKEMEGMEEGEQAQDRVRSASGKLEMDIMTLGPLPTTQHGLIKFLGADKRELGQGVFSLGGEENPAQLAMVKEGEGEGEGEGGGEGETPPPHAKRATSSPCMPLFRTNSSPVGGGGCGSIFLLPRMVRIGSSASDVGARVVSGLASANLTPPFFRRRSRSAGSSSETSGGGRSATLRQTVDLTVGGDCRGTVTFDWCAKVRRRSVDSRLFEPDWHQDTPSQPQEDV
jgi:hypothetical protein